jgi:hypothetical protein
VPTSNNPLSVLVRTLSISILKGLPIIVDETIVVIEIVGVQLSLSNPSLHPRAQVPF